MKYDEHVNSKLREGLKKAVQVIVQQLTKMIDERTQALVDERISDKMHPITAGINKRIDELY